ncbi:tetratricopeptide repeat protein [Tautonia plasticadhaerens]|uniref:Tetratricopeptide repeat protein n=1 Tax=Tautonia plasticadhaerens TaxID=2527974 RepID=A0A518GZ78_9BACT|nr:tetratricopeptide repeat protein [Tautonia plasticadhaerens]QDV33842.1 Tetratricopeptide repeat protein [Tautonia plasticadhaerens]
MSATERPAPRPMRDRRGFVYTPAVGRGLRPWLWAVLIGFALLGATGIYMSSVTLVTWLSGAPQDTYFYMLMVALHLLLGIVLIVPFIVFGFAHLATSWKRPNRAAIRYGLMLLAASIVLLVSGVVLVRIGGFEVRDPVVREVGYWLHLLTPVLAIGLYVRHRLAGPRINWQYARLWSVGVTVVVVLMGLMHAHDPRQLNKVGPREGAKYFFPSEVKTADGNLIPAETLMMDQYCMECHQDAYDGWFHSSHHFSSFNNPLYLHSVRETRKVALERDGDTQASRWCAGCHDVVPFLSGKFDDPKYDDVNDPTAHAGITCTSCHSITHVNSSRGNADYTIEEPQHYPFAYSDNPMLQWVNRTLVKAKPDLHKQTFLKPLHKTAEFCSTCHKVNLPFQLNHYKDFTRGQNHHDSYLLSGVSGHGARSFYYPEVAKTNCTECHMNFVASDDFGAQNFDGEAGREIHNHMFLGANTGLAAALGDEEMLEAHTEYLTDKKVRVDIFGLREGGTVDGELVAPIRPEIPELEPGASYLVEVVVRTLGVGHHFSQGTVDSNEIWVELTAKSGDRVLGKSGGMDERGYVDPYSHFINVYMLDRDGNRIDRRNPQDIFVPLYNRQIPPGAGQVVHFRLDVPEEGIDGPIALEAEVNYRKFDRTYLDHVYGEGVWPDPDEDGEPDPLPIVVMARDAVELPVSGGPTPENPPSPIEQEWQRWNDYGIGLLLEGGDTGAQKGLLKQAEPVFLAVAERYGKGDGWVNLARVYQKEGRIPDALEALRKAAADPEFAAKWTINWLTGQINMRQGNLDAAIKSFEDVLSTKIPSRKFDFSQDYMVINELGRALDRRGRIEALDSPERFSYMSRAVDAFRRTLAIDPENGDAHFGLGQAYAEFAPDRSAFEPWEGPPPEPARLVDLAAEVAAPDAGPGAREQSARELARQIEAFVDGPRPAFASRVGTLIEVVGLLGPAWERQADAPAKAGLSLALESAHKALHNFVRPDETAEGRAIRIAREKDPAADQNAQPIVIHDLHRPGAPGLPDAAGRTDPDSRAESEVTE